jgi:putative ABC transport system permease protein
LTAFLSAAVVATTLLTTGQTATMEAAALAPLGSPATRLITITDDDGRANISSETVAALASLTDVEAILATGTPNDLRMGTGRNQYGAQVALVTVYGNVAGLPDPYPGTPSQAVWLGHDAQGALGWTAPFGTLADSQGREYAVMGGFRAAPPFEFLDGQAITRSRGELYQSVVPTAEPNVSRVYLLATSIEAVPALEHAVPALVRAERRTFTVTAATDLIKAREVVSQALTQPSRALMLALLGGGLLLQAATMFAMVYGRRRDFGRRRALGASRSAVAFLVIVQAMLPAAAGVLVALTVGTWASGAYLGSTPPWSFIAGVGALAVLESALAAVVPALMAVRADPVRLLRVP